MFMPHARAQARVRPACLQHITLPGCTRPRRSCLHLVALPPSSAPVLALPVTRQSPGSKRTAGPPPQILTLSHYDNNWVSPSGGGAAPWRPSSSVAPSSGGGPLSQYDIANEPDLAARQRKRSELAAMVREEWGGQIREKERASAEVSAAGAAWPYAPVHTPNDKRVADAIVRSRPSSAALKRSQAYV